jgi:hypothetical protein
MKKHKQALLHSKAYEFAHSINGNILGLKYPIVIIPQVSKKFAANLNGLYIGETFEGSTIHEIHFSVWHNLTDELLFDTIAHELCHALQIETGNYSLYLPHDDFFFKMLNNILTGSGLPEVDQDYIDLMRSED